MASRDPAVSVSSPAAPSGCGSSLNPLYYLLCDLSSVWGIVLEAFAAAGLLFSFVLLISLLGSLPFIRNSHRRSTVGLHVCFQIFTAGLFCLTFAFIVGKDFSTCFSRRFLFGVFFCGCFACLLVHAVNLNILIRRGNGLRGALLCLAMLGLWLVEVVINTEWLIITVVRNPVENLNSTAGPVVPCKSTNQDFVMALIYVMVLVLVTVGASVSVMTGKQLEWRRDGVLLLLTSLLSVGIWVAWITMLVYGNERTGAPTWDEPIMAIALVANAWVFIIVYIIPEMCFLSTNRDSQEEPLENMYDNTPVGYQTISKEQSAHSMALENKAFSLNERSRDGTLISPYSNYTGQVRRSVYQPTELALVATPPGDVDGILPRASTGLGAHSGNTAPPRHSEHGIGQTSHR